MKTIEALVMAADNPRFPPWLRDACKAGSVEIERAHEYYDRGPKIAAVVQCRSDGVAAVLPIITTYVVGDGVTIVVGGA